MFRRKIQKLLILFCALIITSLFATAPTHAAEAPFSLITSPLPINLTTTPGVPVTTELKVKNNTNTTEKLKLSLFKFSVNKKGKAVLATKSPSDEFMNWVSFSPSTFEAPPNEWRSVKMTISPPSTAALGYYYAVGFSRADNPTTTEPGATLRGQVITFVLLDVNVPGAKRQLEVSDFSSTKKTYEFLPATFNVTVKNTGNIHVVPSGNIFIKRGGKTLATLNLNPGLGNVLPGTSRTFSTAWGDGFPSYQPKLEDNQPVSNPDSTTATSLKWDFSKASSFRIGPYTAQLVMVYDNGTRDVPSTGTLSFWLMPWRVLALIIITPLIPALLVYLIMRRRYKKSPSPRKKT